MAAVETAPAPPAGQAMAPLMESDVGIEHFMNPAAGFAGLVKHRFTDFIVHEIDPSGSIVRLGADEPAAGAKGEPAEPGAREQPGAGAESLPLGAALKAAEDALVGAFGADTYERLCDYLTAFHSDGTAKGAGAGEGTGNGTGEGTGNGTGDGAAKSAGKGKGKGVDLPATDDKAARTAQHKLLRETLGSFCETVTQEGDGAAGKVVQVRGAKSSGGDRRRRGSNLPARSRYLSFVLYKENSDTSAVMGEICRVLRAKKNEVTFAGTKDKRGVTTQRCVIRNRSAAEMQRFANVKKGGWRMRGGGHFLVGSPSPAEAPLRLGDHGGNHFSIVLRDLRLPDGTGAPSPALVAEACESLRASGFINFFGMQRFGRGPLGRGTADIGAFLLRREWEEAARAVLGPGTGEREEVAAVKRKWLSDGDCADALRCLPRFMHIERRLLEALGRTAGGRGYLNGLEALPRNTLVMYIHAFQSRIWNQLAAFRIGRLGPRVAAGDLVLLDERPASARGAAEKRRHRGTAHVVTEEDVAAGRFALDDVVIPLAGHEVRLPANAVGARLEELLEAEGLSIAALQNDSQPWLSCGGDYRRLVCKPGDLDFRVAAYRARDEPLQLTDLDAIAGASLEDVQRRFRSAAAERGDELLEEDRLGAVLSFTLPASAYATMLLRELKKEASDRGGSSFEVPAKRAAEGAEPHGAPPAKRGREASA